MAGKAFVVCILMFGMLFQGCLIGSQWTQSNYNQAAIDKALAGDQMNCVLCGKP